MWPLTSIQDLMSPKNRMYVSLRIVTMRHYLVFLTPGHECMPLAPDGLLDIDKASDHMNSRGKLSYPCGSNDNLSRVSALSLMVIYSIMIFDKLSQGELSYPCRFRDNLPQVSALNLKVIYSRIIYGVNCRGVNCRTHIASKTVYTVLLH